MLIFYVWVMVYWLISGELLLEVDVSLFEEIFEDLMMLVCEVVVQFGNLFDEEVWLFFVYFEVVKDNL